MQSDFGDLCKDARERIAIPTFPRTAIRSAVMHSVPRTRNWRKGFLATLLAGTSALAIAAGAGVWNVTRVVFLNHSRIAVEADNISMSMKPTTAYLRSTMRHLDFPAVLPAGLPKNLTLRWVATSASNALLLEYYGLNARRGHENLTLLLANPRNLVVSRKGATKGMHWRVGAEEVLVLGSTLSYSQLAHIKYAMIASSQHRYAPAIRARSGNRP